MSRRLAEAHCGANVAACDRADPYDTSGGAGGQLYARHDSDRRRLPMPAGNRLQWTTLLAR